jgi:hypothetical protein
MLKTGCIEQTPYKGNNMAIERPTIEQLQELASRLHIA